MFYILMIFMLLFLTSLIYHSTVILLHKEKQIGSTKPYEQLTKFIRTKEVIQHKKKYLRQSSDINYCSSTNLHLTHLFG